MADPDELGTRSLASLAVASAWIDRVAAPLPAERVPLDRAGDRVLAADTGTLLAIPPHVRAACDGFAVRAAASIGAGAYNPLSLKAIPVAAGEPMPEGTDAVVPFDRAECEAGEISVIEPVAAAENVEPEGGVAAAGAVLVRAGTRLAARHVGLLSAAEIGDVAVVCRPRVAIVVAAPQRVVGAGSDGPMIRAAVERDGGVVTGEIPAPRNRAAIAAALAQAAADIVLVIGGTGSGPDDHAAAALAQAGELALHGVALSPGETSGLGRTGSGVPVVLLPGPPAACLWSYELFAGRVIRRRGGRSPELPYRLCQKVTARKIVSAIGLTEICPIRLDVLVGTVEPLPGFAETGLRAASEGDGFAIIAEASEGCPQGAAIGVYLYD
ncbi:MAG: molybdopterin-binding protein [Stellaceae bacterium]